MATIDKNNRTNKFAKSQAMNINVDSAKDTLCKNILIYGYCKYEDKGCAFSHKTGKSTNTVTSASLPTSTTNNNHNPHSHNNNSNSSTTTSITTTMKNDKKKFNLNTPSFQPASTPTSSKFSPKIDTIPTFIPHDPPGNVSGTSSVMNLGNLSILGTTSNNGGKKFNTSATIFTPTSFDTKQPNPYTAMNHSNPSLTSPIQNHILPVVPNLAGNASMTPNNNDLYYHPSSSQLHSQHNTSASNFPLNYHLYAPAPPPRLSIPLSPYETNANEMFIPNDLRETLTKKNAATLLTMNTNLPENINVYHSLVPLDIECKSKVWGVNNAIYKVFSNIDGNAYILRKLDFENFTTIDTDSFKTIKRWKLIKNSNIVKLQDSFTTIGFDGINSKLVMIYDFYANSMTLHEQHIERKLGYKLEPITEDILWSYIIQITNALLSIHEVGLAARSSLDLTKIILTNKNRIKLSSVGIDDILNHENEKGYNIKTIMSNEQQQDLKRFGKVILELSVLLLPINIRTTINGSDVNDGDKLKHLKNVINDELYEIIEKLLNDYESINLNKFNQYYLSARSMKMLNDLQDLNDYIENQLLSELENARLFRLITKLNFIVDSPSLSWKENDKIYLIKLFNDFVFHQLDDANKPVVDLSRVLVKLNKLDVGIDEKFVLISRDEKVSILVSYKEIRDLIDSVFRDLTK